MNIERPLNSQEFEDGFKTTQSKRRELGYTSDIKEFIHENPGVMRDVQAMIAELEERAEAGAIIKNGDIVLESFHDSRLDGADISGFASRAYRCSIGERNFFIKKIDLNHPNRRLMFKKDGGYEEVINGREIETILNDSGLENVRVVNYQLGYTERDSKYLVSDWENVKPGETLMSTLGKLRRGADDELERGNMDQGVNIFQFRKKLLDRMKRVGTVLREHGFDETLEINMIYLPETDEIVVYDFMKVDNE